MQKELIQLGGELKKERETRGIVLKSIADHTKISINFLEAIEAGNFNFLPDPYPRNFLKLYLKQLGGYTNKYLDKFDEITKRKQPSIISDEHLLPSKQSDQLKINREQFIETVKDLKKKYLPFLVAGAVVLIIILTIFSISKNNHQSDTNYLENEPAIVQQDSQFATLSPFTFKKKKLELHLTASQKTWMQLAIDDSAAIEYIFSNGDTSTWYAKEKFLLRIGNSAGIRLYLNGNDMGPLGKEREVVNLLLTKDGVQRGRF